MERIAECHCGQLRAITSGEPESVYVCHCKACQRRTGAIIHNGSRWLKSQVRIEGEHKIYSRKGDSGSEIRFHFCPNCGSSVFWEGDRSPTTWASRSAASPTRVFPAPTSSGYEESMHPWLELPPDTAHFPQSRSYRRGWRKRADTPLTPQLNLKLICSFATSLRVREQRLPTLATSRCCEGPLR